MCCESVKRAFVNFRLMSCCFVAPVKIGINIIVYFKVLVSAMSLLSEGRFSPIAHGVQKLVSEEGKAIPILANIVVIIFNVLLLIAVNKKIPVLLRVFIYYSFAKISVMVIVLWPIINASEDEAVRARLIIFTVTAMSIVFQLYIMLLVRSVIVQIREEIEVLKMPVQIIYTSHKEAENEKAEAAVEIHISKPTEEDSKKVETNENADKSPKEVVEDEKKDKS